MKKRRRRYNPIFGNYYNPGGDLNQSLTWGAFKENVGNASIDKQMGAAVGGAGMLSKTTGTIVGNLTMPEVEKEDFNTRTKRELSQMSRNFQGYDLGRTEFDGNFLGNAVEGAMTGMSVGGPVGALVGAGAGIVLKGAEGLTSWIGNHMRSNKEEELNRDAVAALNTQNTYINENMANKFLSTQLAYGGILPSTRNVAAQLSRYNNNIFAGGGVLKPKTSSLDWTVVQKPVYSQKDVYTIAPRQGVRKNKDGTESTHLMAYGHDELGYTANPTLFQDSVGNWYTKETPMEKWKEAQRRGEVFTFDSEKEAAAFAKGDWKGHWKPNTYAYGGQFSNGVTSFNVGGTHEENPYGGIMQGVGENGEPNFVEEGEVKWRDYIFSDRLKVPKEVDEFLLPKTIANKTYADAAEYLQKESKERELDKISKLGLTTSLTKLMIAQEQQKAIEEGGEGNMFKYGGVMSTGNTFDIGGPLEDNPPSKKVSQALQILNKYQDEEDEKYGTYLLQKFISTLSPSEAQELLKRSTGQTVSIEEVKKIQQVASQQKKNLPFEAFAEYQKDFLPENLKDPGSPFGNWEGIERPIIKEDFPPIVNNIFPERVTTPRDEYNLLGIAQQDLSKPDFQNILELRSSMTKAEESDDQEINYNSLSPEDRKAIMEILAGEGSAAQKMESLGQLGYPVTEKTFEKISETVFKHKDSLTNDDVKIPVKTPQTRQKTPTTNTLGVEKEKTSTESPKEELPEKIEIKKIKEDKVEDVDLEKELKKDTVQDTSTFENPWQGVANDALRFAPIMANIANLTKLMASKPDRIKLDRMYTPFLSDRMDYNPIDSNYMANQMAQQAASTNRHLIDSAGGNRAIAQAALLSANRGSQGAIGDAMLSVNQANEEKLRFAKEFNKSVNQFNIQNSLQTQQYNAAARQQELMWAKQAEAARRAAINQGIMTLGTNIGDMATESRWMGIAPKMGQGYDANANYNAPLGSFRDYMNKAKEEREKRKAAKNTAEGNQQRFGGIIYKRKIK